MPLSITRRTALTAVATTAGASLMPRALVAQQAQVLLPGSEVCALTPEVTEGPYYLDQRVLRADIREDREGVPLLLRMQVVDAACVPLAGARVDIWHCDAQGIYSAFGGGETGQQSAAGETFLRGTQRSDERGLVAFTSIYPGWYRGRTTHIHFKVFLDERTVLTGQIFFPDALSEYLYLNVPAYMRGTTRDTSNADDGIAQQATRTSHAAIKEEDAGYLAQIVVGVDPMAASSAGARPGFAPPPGRRGPPQGERAEGRTRRGSLVPGQN